MNDDKVSFRNHEGAVVCEIKLPDGNVGVFPANDVIPGSDPAQTYAERYNEAFGAFQESIAPPRAAAPAKRKAKAKLKKAAKAKTKAKSRA